MMRCAHPNLRVEGIYARNHAAKGQFCGKYGVQED
jgi:hypothetical protein